MAIAIFMRGVMFLQVYLVDQANQLDRHPAAKSKPRNSGARPAASLSRGVTPIARPRMANAPPPPRKNDRTTTQLLRLAGAAMAVRPG